MKPRALSFVVAAMFAAFTLTIQPSAHAETSFSLSSFSSSVQAVNWNWDTTTSRVTSGPGFDAISWSYLRPVGGAFSPVNLTALDNYDGNPSNLRLNLTAVVNSAPSQFEPSSEGKFAIRLTDNLGNTSYTQFLWNSFAPFMAFMPVTVTVPVDVTTPFNWDNVTDWELEQRPSIGPNDAYMFSLTATAVPEPSTYALVLLGAGAVCVLKRRKALSRS